MEEPILLIPEVRKTMRHWTVRVTITEDIPLQKCKGDIELKRYILTDREGNEIVGSLFGSTVKKMISVFELFKVYDISNAEIRDVAKEYRVLKHLPTEWRFYTDTLIQPLRSMKPNLRYILDSLTPFSLLASAINQSDKTVDIMGVIIQAGVAGEVTTVNGPTQLQCFTLINDQRKPVCINVWGSDMIKIVAPVLEQAAKRFSVVLAKRLTVRHYNGIELSTKNGSSFTIDPPVHPALQLKAWFDTVKDEELPNFLQNRAIELSRERVNEGRINTYTVNEVKKTTQTGEYWIRGSLEISEKNDYLHYVACNICFRRIKANIGTIYPCVMCKQDVESILRTKVKLTISDHTGSINAVALHTVAEQILQTTSVNIERLLQAGVDYDLEGVRADLHGKTFLMSVRVSSTNIVDNDRSVLLLAYFPDTNQNNNNQSGSNMEETGSQSSQESTSKNISLSPLKRQLHECMINKDTSSKRQLLMDENDVFNNKDPEDAQFA